MTARAMTAWAMTAWAITAWAMTAWAMTISAISSPPPGKNYSISSGAVQNIDARSRAEQGLWNEPAWAGITAAGLPHAMLGEPLGGIGTAHALMIIRLAASQALAAPLAETMAANWLLAEAGLEPAAGAATFADTELNLVHEGGAWQAQGLLHRVPWGRACDIVAIARTSDGAPHLVRIDHRRFSVTKNQNIAAEPLDDCDVKSGIAPDSISSASDKFSLSRMRRLGAALRAVQMAGAMTGVLNMTVSYARDRKQFGRSLAGFQAVQQLVAGIATQAAAASVAADLVAEAFNGDLDFSKIAVAKIRTGEAAGAVAAARPSNPWRHRFYPRVPIEPADPGVCGPGATNSVGRLIGRSCLGRELTAPAIRLALVTTDSIVSLA